jgi:hypothetical protein
MREYRLHINQTKIALTVALIFGSLCWQPNIFSKITITEVLGSPITNPFNETAGPDYSPDGKWYAYGGGNNTNSVVLFSYNSAGTLTPLASSPQAIGGLSMQPSCVAYSPDSKFLVALNKQDFTTSVRSRIALFSVDQTTGALTQRSTGSGNVGTGSIQTAGVQGVTISYSPDGQFVAALATITSSAPVQSGMNMYTVNQTTGALTVVPSLGRNNAFETAYQTGTPSSAFNNSTFAFSPDGLFIAQGNRTPLPATITIFSVNQMTGELGPNNGGGLYGIDYPMPIAGNTIESVAYSPNGNILAVAGTNQIYTFTLNNGIPTHAATYSPGTDGQIQFSPDSRFLVRRNSSSFDVISVDDAGFMTLFETVPVEGGFTLGEQFAFSPLFQMGDSQIYFLSAPSSVPSGSILTYAFLNEPDAPLPPTNVIGKRKCNIFLDKNERIITITWNASPTSGVVSYNIYNSSRIVANILATQQLCFRSVLNGCDNGQNFSITALDSNGIESEGASINIQS